MASPSTTPFEDPMVRLYRLRRTMAKEMSEIVQNPSKYNNADVLDWLNDRAKEFRLQMVTRRDAVNNAMIHIFVRDPIGETLDPRAKFENPQYLGWVEKNMQPTPETYTDPRNGPFG